VYYSPSPADRIWWSDQSEVDFASQDASAIQTVLEDLSGDTLTHIYSTENTGSDWTYDGGAAFNYMAIHFDGQELLFYYETAISAFSVTGLAHEFSNARAYTGASTPDPDPVSVSEPTGLGLVALGLCALAATRRRTNRSA
jgi:MYXO-CTERM domain-containing protein